MCVSSRHYPLLLEKERERERERGDAHLELDMLFAVDPVGEEDGGEVDVGEVSAMEGAESVAREAFDPFSACGGVEDGVGGTAHDGLFEQEPANWRSCTWSFHRHGAAAAKRRMKLFKSPFLLLDSVT